MRAAPGAKRFRCRALADSQNGSMPCPTCGEQGTCSCPNVSVGTSLLELEPAGSSTESALQPQLYEPGELWRQEVTSRVDAFCARRGRKRGPRAPSLSLDFERAARATVAAHYAVPEPQVEPTPALPSEPEPNNIIQFPRMREPALPDPEPVPYVEELAAPIIETPRILDAEEPSGLLFGGEGRPAITLESAPEPEPQDDAVPVGESASLSRRILAAAIDCTLVAIAVSVFAIIFLHIAGALPRSRGVLLSAVAIPAVLWAMYQYLFLVHAASTPGMRLAGLRLVTFDDQPVRRTLRRWRAIAIMVSGMALGLGFLWACIDDHGLCWHDRITRTVVRHN
jgi:uncharacterized RDD family membrane protein YckC